MKAIQLSKGMVAVVDDEDFERIAQYRWKFLKSGYAGRTIWLPGRVSSGVLMHRVIMGAQKGEYVDHINENKIDCRKENMRLCTNAQNCANRGKNKNNTSGFKGVTWSKKEKKWIAQIMVNRKHKRIGCFSTAEEAQAAYNTAALQLHGEFAHRN